ncbi:MAG: DUF1801 domain-containing protein [Flavobacteriaceae bacterium]|nr:DUF1801 domain-containing protein [Flavobacteriaceae bacterium]
MDSRVDAYIAKHSNFTKLINEIRKILLSTEFEETIKWGMPTYTINNKNVVGIGAFKSHCGVWFFQGALLKDAHKVLRNAQEGKTQTMRQWRFTNDSKVDKKLLLTYIKEAITNEKKNLRIKPIRTKKPLIIPPELFSSINKNKMLNKSFEALTLSKKREFSEYMAEAKREATKTKRLEKIIPMIMNNVGLHDKYKNC